MRIRTLLVLSALVISIWISVAVGQDRRFSKYDSAQVVELNPGDTFHSDSCRVAWVMNEAAINQWVGQRLKHASAIEILQSRLALEKQVGFLQDSVVSRFRSIDSLQNLFYGKLRELFDRSDALTVRSLKNTEQALNYIGKVKLMGYVSSTVTGGISGGLLGGQLQSGGNPAIRFSWPGALAGAVGGCVIYYLFMKVID